MNLEWIDKLQTQVLDAGPDEIKSLQSQVRKNPGDEEARVKLTFAAFLRLESRFRKVFNEQVLWFIRNDPGSPTLRGGLRIDHWNSREPYYEGLRLLKEAARKNPKSAEIRSNLADYLLFSDRKQSLSFMREAVRLEPDNAEWQVQLGHILSLHQDSDRARPALAKEALAAYEKAVSLNQGLSSQAAQSELARTALSAREWDRAKLYAEEMLQNEDGNSLHQGNTVLGLLEVRSGNIEKTERHLLASATKGSPTLDSFGPNMLLARALLRRKRKDAVLKYFEKCREFWYNGDQLDEWASDVRQGRIPDFGSNLSY